MSGSEVWCLSLKVNIRSPSEHKELFSGKAKPVTSFSSFICNDLGGYI